MQEIINKQIEQHANFALKTEYSKAKYKKRKEMKYATFLSSPLRVPLKGWPRYSKMFTVIEPTMHNVCDYWFNKDQNRIRDIRPDTLAQMLNLASVRPGGKYIVVDDASGVVVSAVLDRLGGKMNIGMSFTRAHSPQRTGTSYHDMRRGFSTRVPGYGPDELPKRSRGTDYVVSELGDCGRRVHAK